MLALTGKDGRPLAALATVKIRVPHLGYADRIQEIHGKGIHILLRLMEHLLTLLQAAWGSSQGLRIKSERVLLRHQKPFYHQWQQTGFRTNCALTS